MPTQEEVFKYLDEIVKDIGISFTGVQRHYVQEKFGVSEQIADEFVILWGLQNSQ